MAIVDDFEDGDLSEYGSQTSNYGTFQMDTSTVWEGGYSAEYNSYSDRGWDYCWSDSGLPEYPKRGGTIEYYTHIYGDINGMDLDETFFNFGGTGPGDSYAIRVSRYGDFDLIRKTGTGGSYNYLSQSSFSINQDTWYRVVIDWGTTISASIYTTGGSRLASVSATDSTYDSGGIGFEAKGTGHQAYWDYITYSGPPSPPSNASLSLSGDDATVTWSDNSSTEDGFHIDRHFDGSWSRVGDVGANTTSFSETNLLDGEEYRYRVRSYNSNGGSDWSYTSYSTTPLSAPSVVTQSIDSPTSISIGWENHAAVNGIEKGHLSDDLTFYANQWGGSSNGGEIDISGTQFTTYDGITRDITPVNNGVALQDNSSASGFLMYSQESVHTRFSANPPHTDNCDHIIGVRYNGGWEYDDNGAWISFTPHNTDILLAELEWGVDSIKKLAHGDYNADSYAVEISADGGSWVSEASVNGSENTYTASVSKSTDTFKWRVRSETEHTSSTYTSTGTVSTNVGGLTADATRATEIDVSWGDVDQESGYYVYRAQASGSTAADYTQVADLASGTTAYTDTGLENGERYYYRVAAYYGTTADALSGEVDGITTLPASSIGTVDTTIEDEITIDWTKADNSSDGDWAIYRSTDGTLGTQIATPTIGARSYTDGSLSDGEKYYYTLRRRSDHDQADSTQDSGVALLPAPTGLTVDAVNGDQADLSWTPNHDYGNQRVELKPTDASTWSNDSGELTKGTTSYTTTALLDGEKYDCRVVAYTEHTETIDN